MLSAISCSTLRSVPCRLISVRAWSGVMPASSAKCLTSWSSSRATCEPSRLSVLVLSSAMASLLISTEHNDEVFRGFPEHAGLAAAFADEYTRLPGGCCECPSRGADGPPLFHRIHHRLQGRAVFRAALCMRPSVDQQRG